MATTAHAIKAVALETGLSPHVIRIWEKRYGAVRPIRTETNRRLYSAEDVERLKLLRDATRAGHSISTVAPLQTEALRALSARSTVLDSDASATPHRGDQVAEFLEESLKAVADLDAKAFEKVLERASMALGTQGILQRVIAPLAQKIGDQWRNGTITAAHEHFASAIIRVLLGHSARSFVGVAGAPVLVTATPHGQLHELGALLVAATAANLGWSVTYLGASLPAMEIAGAVHLNRARAVALSIVYPEDDPRMEQELTQLRQLLPRDVSILIGGRAMPAYSHAVEKIGALKHRDLNELCSTLERLRSVRKE